MFSAPLNFKSVVAIEEIGYKKIDWEKISKDQRITLFLIGIFGSSYAYHMQVGFNLAPNVGFVNATNAASISLLTLVAAFIFTDELAVKIDDRDFWGNCRAVGSIPLAEY